MNRRPTYLIGEIDRTKMKSSPQRSF